MKNIQFNFKSLRAFLLYVFTAIGLFNPSASALESDGTELKALEESIDQAESTFNDVIPETKKVFRWFDTEQPVKTEFVVLYLHGFSASRQEISPVTERLADLMSANAFYTRLTGHGRDDEAMAEASVDDWQQDAIQAFEIAKKIGDKVILVSTSTGATLATWLMNQLAEDSLHANIMVSPNFGLANRSGEIVRWDWGLRLAKWVNGDYRSFEPTTEAHRLFWTERYPMEALVPMVKLVDEVVKIDKSSINVPQLVIYSPNDQVINPDKVVTTAAEFTNAHVELVEFTGSEDPGQHVLAGDACSPASNDKMVGIMHDFLTKTVTKIKTDQQPFIERAD